MDTKFFKDLTERRSKNYSVMLKALDIVKRFIIDKKRILYGGMAIHLNLLKAGKPGIYEKNVIPDYDFMSPDFYNDSIELADILFKSGFEDISSINALHCTSRKVRIAFIPVADMTYIPENIYQKLKFNVYDGMRIIHPDFQRADIHRAFCIPYNNPPMEVILHRLSKDVKRFNLLNQAYPLPPGLDPKLTETELDLPKGNYLLTGVHAYWILNQYKSKFLENKEPKFIGVNWRKEILVLDEKPFINSKFTHYNRYLELRPQTWESPDKNLYVMLCYGELIPYYEVKGIKIAHPSHLLLFFMQQYFETAKEEYLWFYNKTLEMVGEMEKFYMDKDLNYDDLPYFMSKKVFGEVNMSMDNIANADKNLRPPFGYYPPKPATDWSPDPDNIVFLLDGMH